MEKADKVTIRLTADQAAALDFLIKEGRFKNRSDAIRVAVDLMTKEPEVEQGKIPVEIPDGTIAMIDKLVEMGHFRSRDLGIFELVRDGLDSIDLDALIIKMRQRQDILAEKKAKDILEDVYSDYVQQ